MDGPVDWTWPVAKPGADPNGGTVIWTDGACHPNPGGTATYGYVVRRAGALLHTGAGLVTTGAGATNNVAELAAVYMALKWLAANPTEPPVMIRTDSQFAVNLITGRYKAKKPHLKQHVADILARLRALPVRPAFVWVPRELNAEADAAAG